MTARGRVLLVEDNPVNQLVARAMLENLGFEVELAADGAEAVRAASATPHRAILMDCQIPVLDGYQATREIRRAQGESERTPIVAITASTSEADRQRCLAAGMDDFLTKPLGLAALSAVFSRWAPDGSEAANAADPARPGAAADVAAATRPVLDAEVVGRLERLGRAAGRDLVGQLATLFLADADAGIVALRQSLADDDAGAVRRSAHTLRGASANLGATDLAALFAKLSASGAAGDLAGGGALVQAVASELERVRTALRPPIPTP